MNIMYSIQCDVATCNVDHLYYEYIGVFYTTHDLTYIYIYTLDLEEM